MITPIDEACLDPRVSCTEDEAIAKLLGWMIPRWRIPNLLVTEDGIDLGQLPLMLTLPSQLDEFIADAREFASIRIHNAVCAGDQAAINKWEEREILWRQFGDNAFYYRMKIQQELSSPHPKLQIDHALTQETGMRHITLISLDLWARRTLAITVLSADEIPEHPKTGKGMKRPRIKFQEQAAAILEKIRQLGHDPESLPQWQPTAPGVKSQVRKGMNFPCPLFPTEDRFEKVWEELSVRKVIIYKVCPPK